MKRTWIAQVKENPTEVVMLSELSSSPLVWIGKSYGHGDLHELLNVGLPIRAVVFEMDGPDDSDLAYGIAKMMSLDIYRLRMSEGFGIR